MSHDFPDQPYLDRIRAALWQRGAHGNATVMVGAGMSLNARPRSAGSGRFPTWSDLARTVVDHLYPAHGGAHSGHRHHALLQANSTSGFLRLAQEYETAFGREALERLIADAVPDLRFEPGDLHQRLLALPWSDIFTTNWDTLLERAATHIVDRHYDVVRTIADIPGSARPRIVKLHGTLPATRPFIFTEEDFRTYPVRFAPFVNVAQQAMMENVFCLLGFSGDDPNFLYWSGWVRDHLRDYAPHIYLVGWLDLPPPRRRMLEGRGVVPIDLAHLPLQAPWPEETRHRRALEWFLWSLEAAEPYRVTDWPEVPDRRAQDPPAYLPAVLSENADVPRQERAGPKNSGNLDEIRNAVEVWRHNRRLYPGWLVAPPSARSRLWWNTEAWISAVLELLPSLTPTERIEVLEELNWRLETSLVPLTAQLVAAISEALPVVDSLGTDRDLRGRWVRLAAALLRAARESDDDTAFERWTEALAPHRPDHTWLGPRIAYERCLLSLARLDHAAVELALEDLDTGADEVFWKVRKAGILAELGKTEESFRLAREALPEIRQQLGHGVADIPTLSREGWAMALAEGFIFYPHPREPMRQTNSQPTRPLGVEPRERAARRWEVLQRHGCDARDDLFETRHALEGEPPGPEPEVVETLGFDLWHRSRSGRGERWSSRGEGWEHLPALQAKRLVEETGIPPVVDIDLSKRLLLRAAVWLAEPAPGLALGVLLRVSTYEEDKTFQEFFNRSRIAQLADSQVEALVERVSRALDYGVPRAAAASTEGDHERADYWVSRMRVAVEVLSRLILRLDGARAERVLDRALGYYHLPLFREHHWLIKPLAHLVSRTLNALNLVPLRARLAGFLALPLPEEGDFDTQSPRDWPDPFCLAAKRFGDASPEPVAAPEWGRTIDRLIAAVASTPQLFPRRLALDRLNVLLRWGILTEAQESSLAEALWRHRPPGGRFPEGTEFFNFAYLALPAPDPGLAEGLFRQQYFEAPLAQTSLYHEEFFRNLLGVTEIQQQGKTSLILSSAEIEQILERILAGWRSGQLRRETEDPRSWHYFPFDLEDYRKVFANALGKVILPRLEPASSKIGEVVEMVADLRSLDFPVESTYPALARLRPDLMPEVSDRLRQRLVSSRRDQAEGGIEAVWWWLREGQQLGLGEPPSDLVREIAIAISMRRPSLQHALRAAEWVLRNGAVVEADRFARLVAEGLGYLLSTARYEAGLVRQSMPGFRPNEIAEVRILCIKAALALESTGFGGLHSVGEWIREGQNDPFPEVRHALSESQ